MELLKKIIDQLPYILMAAGFFVWASSSLVTAKAKADPKIDAWDTWAPKLQWASHLYSEAIDWLSDSKNLNLGPQQTKLGELNRLVKDFENKINSGKYIEAVTEVVGFWTAARNKNVPPLSLPMAGPQAVGGLPVQSNSLPLGK